MAGGISLQVRTIVCNKGSYLKAHDLTHMDKRRGMCGTAGLLLDLWIRISGTKRAERRPSDAVALERDGLHLTK